MSNGILMPSCLKCQWRMRNFRARSDSFCRLHEMVIYDTLGTLCPELANEEQPELREALVPWHLEKPGIYVWLPFFRQPVGDEPPYYHEPAFLTDYSTYSGWRADMAMRAQHTLHAQIKATRDAR